MAHSFVSFVPLAPPFSLMNYLNHMSSSQWQRMTRGYHWSNIKLSIPRNSMNMPSSKSQSSPRINKNRCGLREVHLKDVRVESTIDLRRAQEFYLGPGYTEWELKEDTWRNSWKTWDFGMGKKNNSLVHVLLLLRLLVISSIGLRSLRSLRRSGNRRDFWSAEVTRGEKRTAEFKLFQAEKDGSLKDDFLMSHVRIMSAMSHLFAH